MPGNPTKRALLVVAAPAEARAVLRALGAAEALADHPWQLLDAADGFDVLVTGVGKVNAAGALARFLDVDRHRCALNVGVAGALPSSGLAILATVVATTSVYADEGLLTPAGFTDCAAMGFPPGPWGGSAVPLDPGILTALKPLADAAGPIATVSTCSGTDSQARAIRERTGALAEGMEGAAVAHVAARLGIPCGELRVISNTCGDRARQQWDLKGALGVLERVIGRVRSLRLGDPRES
jgi:futalosine hydrolase